MWHLSGQIHHVAMSIEMREKRNAIIELRWLIIIDTIADYAKSTIEPFVFLLIEETSQTFWFVMFFFLFMYFYVSICQIYNYRVCCFFFGYFFIAVRPSATFEMRDSIHFELIAIFTWLWCYFVRIVHLQTAWLFHTNERERKSKKKK